MKSGAFCLWLLLWTLEHTGDKGQFRVGIVSLTTALPDFVILLTLVCRHCDGSRDCVTGNGGWRYKMDVPKLSHTNVGQACLMLVLLTILCRRALWECPVCLQGRVLQPLGKQVAHAAISWFSMSGDRLFLCVWRGSVLLVMGPLGCCFNQLSKKE